MRSLDRRDPAPSRWAFRIQRLWLTPYFRKMVRVGFPVLASVLVTAWFFSIEANRTAIQEQFTEVRRSIAERPEFMVKAMAIDGASSELGEGIREVLPVDFPVSSFDLDLETMKSAVEQLDAVAAADLVIRPGGILQLNVTERVPAVVWRDRHALELLDIEGRRVASLNSRLDRSDLPLIVGEGANKVVREALALYAVAGPIEQRLRGLVRVGERRWDLALTQQQVIMLPERQGVHALQQVIAIDEAKELLTRNITHVDMRNPDRPTLRLAEPAMAELHRIRALELGE